MKTKHKIAIASIAVGAVISIIVAILGSCNSISSEPPNNIEVNPNINVNPVIGGRDVEIKNTEPNSELSSIQSELSSLKEKNDKLEEENSKLKESVTSNDNTSTQPPITTVSAITEQIITTQKISKTYLYNLDNIHSGNYLKYNNNSITDNYGNKYNNYYDNYSRSDVYFYALLDNKYETFNVTFFVPNSTTDNYESILIIKTFDLNGDEKEERREILTKIDKPIEIEVDVTGVNEFSISLSRFGRLSNAYFT